jgi:hypothetical protein
MARSHGHSCNARNAKPSDNFSHGKKPVRQVSNRPQLQNDAMCIMQRIGIFAAASSAHSRPVNLPSDTLMNSPCSLAACRNLLILRSASVSHVKARQRAIAKAHTNNLRNHKLTPA